MNIFAISDSPIAAGVHLVDKHIVKMPLETAQMLCAAHYVLKSNYIAPYKPTHLNHPCSKWVIESEQNYDWLVCHGIAMCLEYAERYNKQHACLKVILWADTARPFLPKKNITPFAKAMPVEYQIHENPVICYQQFYMHGKKHLHAWKNNKKPSFLCN